ncbi:MAG: phosphate acyltransferase, partial [Oscillospiraceae bacterium]
MVFKTFDELAQGMKKNPTKKRMAVAVAGDEHTLEAVLAASSDGIIVPILVGEKNKIQRILEGLGKEIPDGDIIDESDEAEACKKAVALVKEGKADFIMKGMVETKIILKAVVDKENGLGKGGIMSHFTMFQVPTYHKLLVPVDGGMVTYPTLMEKKAIIENTVDALLAMGYDLPKVGVLACVEKL